MIVEVVVLVVEKLVVETKILGAKSQLTLKVIGGIKLHLISMASKHKRSYYVYSNLLCISLTITNNFSLPHTYDFSFILIKSLITVCRLIC